MLILGLMSGTSADGIDVALARVEGAPPRLRARVLKHTTIAMPRAVRAEVLRIAEGAAVPAGVISQLNFRLGRGFCRGNSTGVPRVSRADFAVSI